MKQLLFCFFLGVCGNLLCGNLLYGQSPLKTENVFLITLDGLRWQEVFSGADPDLISNKEYVSDTTALKQLFWKNDPVSRREVLMPFFWEVIARQGQLYGNRPEGSSVNVTNPYWFSYPGYNEILTGLADPGVNSNDKIPNPNKTVLEFVNHQPDFKGKVAAFASWDVFPSIINEQRSGVPVNAGFDTASARALTERERFLNRLQPEIPSPWSSVRLDAFTHHYALEYLKKNRPSLLYIAYGETDDFAHGGDYDEYLKSARRTDEFIRELWEWAQQHKQYRGKTTFIITTDHGRGTQPLATWKSHGDGIKGADEIWIAVLGPDTPAMHGTPVKGQFYQNQVAKTVSEFLGLEYEGEKGTGAALKEAFGKQ